MGNFVSLSAELRPSAHAPNGEKVIAAFRITNLEAKTECLVARYAPPCEIRAIATILTIAILTHAKRVADESTGARHSRGIYARARPIRMGVEAIASSPKYRDFSDAMGRVFRTRRARYGPLFSNNRSVGPCPLARPLSVARLDFLDVELTPRTPEVLETAHAYARCRLFRPRRDS